MKYKTLFRLLLKVIGVMIVAQAIGSLASTLVGVGVGFLVQGPAQQNWYFLAQLVYPIVQVVVGCYLFFGGKWIADKAIPGNRPYCHECGYDLTNAAGNLCSECGTPFKSTEMSSAP